MEEKYKIHAFYILTILTSVIVILITVQWSGIPNLAEKISFALTLASLILAALAIGYAVYSNTTFSQTISTLNTVARDVSDSSQNISNAATDLSQKIEAIPSRLESMEVKVDQTNILLQQFSERGEAQPPSEKEKMAAREIVDSFLERTSPAGLLMLYAYSLAFTQNKTFNAKELISSLSNIDINYARGFIVATRSAGLLDSTSDNYVVTVTYVEEKLRSYLVNNMETHFQNLPNRYNVDEEIFRGIKEANLKDKQQIDSYFDEH